MNHHESPSGELIRALLRGAGGFARPPVILSGISAKDALALTHPSPHSIAAVSAHIDFWQSWVLRAVEGKPQALPERAEEGWPDVSAEAWPELVRQILKGLEHCERLTKDEALLKRPLSPNRALGGTFDRHTVGSALSEVVALHNAYHLGQIVLLRRGLGLWPPEEGDLAY